MGDLEAVIKNALDTARESGDLSDLGDDSGSEGVDEGSTTEESAGAEETPEKESTEGEGDETSGAKSAEGVEGAEGVETKGTEKVEKPNKKPKEEDLYDGTDDAENRRRAGKDNRIPYQELRRISDNRERKTNLAIAEALGFSGVDPKSYTPSAFKTALDTHVKELKDLRAESADFKVVRPVMFGDPDRFLAFLAKAVNPEYANYARKGTESKEPPSGKTTIVDDKSDPKPQPDMEVTLPDGRKGMTYSPEGFVKVLEWATQRGARLAETNLRSEMDKRFAPLDAERKYKEDSARNQETLERIIDHEIARVSKRPAFKEHEKEIQEVYLSKYKDLPIGEALDRAYDEVVTGKLTVSYDDLFKKVMADIKKQASPTSITSHDSTKKKEDEPEGAESDDDSTTRVIRKSLSKAKKAGLLA